MGTEQLLIEWVKILSGFQKQHMELERYWSIKRISFSLDGYLFLTFGFHIRIVSLHTLLESHCHIYYTLFLRRHMASLTDMHGMNKGMIVSALIFLLLVRAENTWKYTSLPPLEHRLVGRLPVQCCRWLSHSEPPLLFFPKSSGLQWEKEDAIY